MRVAWTIPFLDELRATGNVSAACRVAGIATSTAYTRRSNESDFANDWDNALEDSIDILEAEARHRALHGIEEPVVYQGQLTPLWERDAHGEIVLHEVRTPQPDKDGKPQPDLVSHTPRQLVIEGKPQWLTLRKKSDPLLMFMLKGLRRRVYGTDATEISGPGGTPLQIDSSTRAARVAALMELARQRRATSVDDLA